MRNEAATWGIPPPPLERRLVRDPGSAESDGGVPFRVSQIPQVWDALFGWVLRAELVGQDFSLSCIADAALP